ncbi:MAG: hypothetical protein ACE5JN_12505 [Candidatus Methylomirabilia bacterium]
MRDAVGRVFRAIAKSGCLQMFRGLAPDELQAFRGRDRSAATPNLPLVVIPSHQQPVTNWWHTSITIAAAIILVVVASAVGADSHTLGPVANRDAPWAVHIRRVDEALAQKDVSAAMRAWHHAYIATKRSRRWQGLVEVGDAYLRIGRVSSFRKASESRARQLYLKALSLAANQRSFAGVRRAAEAFAALGDGDAVDECVRIAERLAAQAPDRMPLAKEPLDALC